MFNCVEVVVQLKIYWRIFDCADVELLQDPAFKDQYYSKITLKQILGLKGRLTVFF